MKNNFANKLMLIFSLVFVLALSVGLMACGSVSGTQSSSESASSSQSSSESEQNSQTSEICSHQVVIDEGVDATCIEPGLTSGAHCTICGEILVKQEQVSAKGHNYANGICIRCGASEGGAVVTGKLSFKTLTISGSLAYGKVSNATSKFAFANEIEVTAGYDYVVALDEFGIQTSLTKEVPLSVGDNLFYIFENKNGSIVNTYVVTIRRRPIHTVQFNTNGGSSISSQKVEEDGFANEPTSDPTKTGYTFGGWDYNFNTPITSNKTVNANWQANQYKVTYNANGGEASKVEDTATYDSYFTLATVERIGYTFVGWKSNGKTYTNGNWKTAQDVTLVAEWKIINYDIVYELNGGDNGNNPYSYTVEEEVYLEEPTRVGYDFVGWTTNDILEPTKEVVIAKGSIGEKAFVANWRAITYTLRYDLNGGTLENANPTEYTIESNFALNAPTKEGISEPYQMGYEFLGWYDGDVRLTTLKGCTGNKTLTARWGGEYLFFGEYPQTIKEDGVSITSTTNQKGYFLGNDGAWYAGVTATPNSSSYTFSNNVSVTSGTTYYFKVEPIKWQVLSTDGVTAKVVCASIIANHRFDDSSNNYAQSEIRAWLNNEFYNQAFTSLQQELIVTTQVDNSAASTGFDPNQYACEDTNDKIYLLSYAEAYAMDSTTTGASEARERLTSDYSRATGVWMSTSTSYYGNGYWWLRSPYSYDSLYAYDVDFDGNLSYCSDVCNANLGVVPALQIRL